MIETYNPSIAVVALSSITWDKDYDFVSKLRTKFPGIHITVFSDTVCDEYFFNLIMRVADEAFLDPFTYDIVNYRLKSFSSFNRIKSYLGNKKAKLVETHLPRHELFDSTLYRWPFVKHSRYAAVYTQFGCPYVCTYCPLGAMSVSYRSADNVLAEIQQIYKNGYKEIQFGDETFGTPKENIIKILHGMKDAGYKFSWSAYTYPGLVDFDYLSLMKDSGCHTLVIGIDSCDFSLLRKYRRQIDKDIILRFLENARRLNIDVCGDFILGFEEEDEEQVLNTIKFALSCGLDYASFNVACPLFTSYIREQKKKAGFIRDNTFGFDTAGFNIVRTQKLNKRQLRQLHSLAVRKFYLRPGYILKRISKIRSLEEFILRFIEGIGVLRNVIVNKMNENK
jgi:radical SAM superfamily enzyme YgiQ (UPF0313 family)